MSDGCRLAARIRLPADAEARPVPALLEYTPYRKRDFAPDANGLAHGDRGRHPPERQRQGLPPERARRRAP